MNTAAIIGLTLPCVISHRAKEDWIVSLLLDLAFICLPFPIFFFKDFPLICLCVFEGSRLCVVSLWYELHKGLRGFQLGGMDLNTSRIDPPLTPVTTDPMGPLNPALGVSRSTYSKK